MASGAVAGFLPSTHGLHFANRFPPGPTVRLGPIDPRVIGIGDASAGLCGGMSFTVRDLWEHGVLPPPDTEPPANGSARFTSLVRRQVQSLDWLRVPLHFFRLAALVPSSGGWLRRLLRGPSLARRSLDDAWPAIRAEIDAGRLAQVGLVRVQALDPRQLTQNHQVLAYGYDDGPDAVVVRAYDPNHPDRDDVTLRIERGGGGEPRLAQSTGEPLAGIFLAPYRPADPTAWRRPA